MEGAEPQRWAETASVAARLRRQLLCFSLWVCQATERDLCFSILHSVSIRETRIGSAGTEIRAPGQVHRGVTADAETIILSLVGWTLIWRARSEWGPQASCQPLSWL